MCFFSEKDNTISKVGLRNIQHVHCKGPITERGERHTRITRVVLTLAKRGLHDTTDACFFQNALIAGIDLAACLSRNEIPDHDTVDGRNPAPR